ncbi:MAG: hypothetical protein AAF725_11495 [Acidobacteriota bacterium]
MTPSTSCAWPSSKSGAELLPAETLTVVTLLAAALLTAARGLRVAAASARVWGGPAVCALALLLGALGPAAPAAASGSTELGGLDLKAPVRHQLFRLQQAWQGWNKAFLEDDSEAAATELEQMLVIARFLSMDRLPDLSNAAAAMAIREAQAGRHSRAREALQAARQLDPERPENDFAAAELRRSKGDYLGALAASSQGYLQLLKMPIERSLWLHNALLWGLYTALLAAAVFVGVLMLVNGRRLFYDFSRLYSPPLPGPAADAVTLLLLVWPALLPSGFLWLGLYWSILLWSYASRSTRVMLIFGWLLLGITPSLLGFQQRSTRVAMVPAARLVENLAQGRLYGAIFSDLEVLRSLVPDSDVVDEIVADLHRRLGQWDYARAIYTELAQDPDRPRELTAAAYCNIGVYHHQRGDYQTAVNYFARAADADPNLAEAFFNLSQAYAQLFDFSRQHEAMGLAKDIDQERVEAWNEAAVTAEESAVAVDGGVRRVEELRERISELWKTQPREGGLAGLWTRFQALSVSLAALALALAVAQVRQQIGYFSDRLDRQHHFMADNRWCRALLPGMASLHRDRGILGYFAILVPVGLVTLMTLDSVGYRLPLALGPTPWLTTALGLGGLLLIFLARFATALREED